MRFRRKGHTADVQAFRTAGAANGAYSFEVYDGQPIGIAAACAQIDALKTENAELRSNTEAIALLEQELEALHRENNRLRGELDTARDEKNNAYIQAWTHRMAP